MGGLTKDTFRKSKNYARLFGPFSRETNINGEYVSVQLYGAISGINAKKKIQQPVCSCIKNAGRVFRHFTYISFFITNF